jgi:GH35 family endo-1,4-beta-xylanase
VVRKKIISILVSAAVAAGVLTAAPIFGASVYAQQSEKGLKDIYANYFRIGTAYQWRENGLNDQTMRDVILREFNSLTHEDELKPDNTMLQSGSTDDSIRVQLNAGARTVLQFAVDNNIPVRGHALVWHQQTPHWFFRADMQSDNTTAASAAVMNRRMESYIKNILQLIKQEFPNLNLYAYDVVNEIFLDNGSARLPGGIAAGSGSNNTDSSPWVQIYGNNFTATTHLSTPRSSTPADTRRRFSQT